MHTLHQLLWEAGNLARRLDLMLIFQAISIQDNQFLRDQLWLLLFSAFQTKQNFDQLGIAVIMTLVKYADETLALELYLRFFNTIPPGFQPVTFDCPFFKRFYFLTGQKRNFECYRQLISFSTWSSFAGGFLSDSFPWPCAVVPAISQFMDDSDLITFFEYLNGLSTSLEHFINDLMGDGCLCQWAGYLLSRMKQSEPIIGFLAHLISTGLARETCFDFLIGLSGFFEAEIVSVFR
jgi:hypothetical protein